jgi:hypothetical protein
MLTTLGACGVSPGRPALSDSASAPPPPPEIAPDIRACTERRYAGQVRDYSTGEIMKILKAEGNKVDRLSGCLARLICSTQDYRVLVSKVEGEALCDRSRLPGKKK